MNGILYSIGISALAISLSACDSAEDNRREEAREDRAAVMDEQADVVRERGDAQANAIKRSEAARDSELAEDAEDAAASARDTAEMRADEIEDQADQLRGQD